MSDNENTRNKERSTRSGGKSWLGGLLLLALLGGGVGIGFNNGFFDGNGQGSGAGEQSGETTPEETSDTVIIKIEESTVKVNDHVCNNEQELKDYLQEIHNDNKVWILEDDHAILSSYEMVVKVCKELNIDLKE